MFEHKKAAGRLLLAVLAAALWIAESSAPAQAKKSAGGAPAAVQPVSNPANLPRAIYLMRHADKPASPGDPHLSEAGVARARKLPGYFPGLLGGQRLNYIFATAASKNSNRPVETVTPLAGSLHLPINQSYSNKSYGALAAAIRSNGSYAGNTIL